MVEYFKEEIAKLLSAELKKDIQSSEIEKPPSREMGDYAFPCFSLAKELRKNPVDIAKDIAEKIKPEKYISDVKNLGSYVNFFVKQEELSKRVLQEIYERKERYGSGKKKKEKVMIESPGPNTNKPLHLGHVRNMLLGNCLVNLFRFLGYPTVRVDIINDRGVHICKSMLAYKYFGGNKEPDKKPDHFVGDWYVRYAMEVGSHPEFEPEIQDMLKRWEDNDTEVRNLWKKMNNWALEGFKETYDRYGVVIDKPYYESEHYMKGRDLVLLGYKKGLFQKDDKGNIFVDLSDKGLGKKILLRGDGTSIYITQDISLAKIRKDEYNMKRMVYIVGNEQIHHFKVLFEIFRLLGYPFADGCYHLAYGMVNLPEGKMKSREGKVVDADDLAEQMHQIAKDEIEKRYPGLSSEEIDKRAEEIGMAAIKFFILKFDPMGDFVFNPKESISFEGETGPYVQYTHARAASVLRRFSNNATLDVDYSLLTNHEEKNLVMLLGEFPSVVKSAAESYKPSLLTRHLLDLSQAFNEYYHKHKILQEDKELEKARILLTYSVKQILDIGLALLGIKAPEVM